MDNHKKLCMVGAALAVVSLALALRWGGPTSGWRPAAHADVPAVPARSVAPGPSPSPRPVSPRGGRDPSAGWASHAEAPAATAAAVAFAKAFVLVPPGATGPVVAAHCRALVTPAFRARLTSSPGAPALGGLAAPVRVVSVSAALEDWEPAGAGVAVGMWLRVGVESAPSFLGLGVHVVGPSESGTGRAWLVDGLEL
jgi:hypothetical protein